MINDLIEILGYKLPKTTVSGILKLQSEILNQEGETIKFRLRKCEYPQLEDCLYCWMGQALAKQIAISDEMLISKAKDFGNLLDIKDFGYSNGWLEKFKKRHGIKVYKYMGESGNVDVNLIKDSREALKKLTDGYEAKDIYNFDETALFYKLTPDTTLATNGINGIKQSKERLTVALCVNADGSDKLKPIVINKSKAPRCFGKTFNPSSIV